MEHRNRRGRGRGRGRPRGRGVRGRPAQQLRVYAGRGKGRGIVREEPPPQIIEGDLLQPPNIQNGANEIAAISNNLNENIDLKVMTFFLNYLEIRYNEKIDKVNAEYVTMLLRIGCSFPVSIIFVDRASPG